MQAFLVRMGKIIVESGADLSDTERQLVYERSSYMFGAYICSKSNND